MFLGTHGTNGTHRTHGTNETNGTQKRKEIVAKVKKMRILSFMHLFIYWVMGVPRGSLRVPGVPGLENFAVLNFTVSLGSKLTAKLKKWLYQNKPLQPRAEKAVELMQKIACQTAFKLPRFIVQSFDEVNSLMKFNL